MVGSIIFSTFSPPNFLRFNVGFFYAGQSEWVKESDVNDEGEMIRNVILFQCDI